MSLENVGIHLICIFVIGMGNRGCSSGLGSVEHMISKTSSAFEKIHMSALDEVCFIKHCLLFILLSLCICTNMLPLEIIL